jgi:Ni,Fe-hydrogenase maturation factor
VKTAGARSASSHHVEPGDLVGLALELWGAAPPVFTVTVGVASMELDEHLSPSVEGVLPRVVDAIAAIVADHGDA